MAGKIILLLAVLTWGYWAYEFIPMHKHPERFKGEEFVLVKCWAVMAIALTVTGIGLVLRKSRAP